MNFIDKVKVYVQAGNGGDGCLSFKHEKYMEWGGPNGGDGGRGGDVWLEAKSRLTTLMDLHFRPHVEAGRGGHGKGSHKHGHNGSEVVIPVPVGTLVYKDGVLVADLHKDGQRWRAGEGGRGGRGNWSFKTHSNTAPRLAEKGGPGEKLTLDLELKLLADVGMVGFPNAGKSSFLARVSSARPKIADYPFTTLSPNLGVAYHKHVSFVVADIPGLIEGAAGGKGLGVKFLKHVERTRLLIHLVDPMGYMGEDPVDGIKTIDKELKTFSAKLAAKPKLVVLNKTDLPEAADVLKRLKKKYKTALAISVATGDGMPAVLDKIIAELNRHDGPVHFVEKTDDGTVHKVEQGFTVENLGGGNFLLRGRFVERASAMLDVSLPEAIARYQNTLKRIGVERALKKIGIKRGDHVRCGEFEFEWSDAPHKKLAAKRADGRTRIGIGKK
ncbi:MAG: GTPase ObgE [Elusimicrobiota bacterium]|nr:MAG: GTPase ObgE [Elusimicrobiota bacterium]